MKRKLFPIIVILFLLTSCYAPSVATYQAVEEPDLNRSPLQGRWIITKVVYFLDEEIDGELLQELVGKEVVFSPSFVVFHSQLSEDIDYTMTKVDTDYYLKFMYNKKKADLGIRADKLFLLSAFSKDKEVFTVLREKENIAYINLYGNLLQLIKTKEELSEEQLGRMKRAALESEKYHSSTFPQ